MVSAVIPTSIGRCSEGMASRSMTTDVPRMPRARRASGTRLDVLIGHRVQVTAKSGGIHGRRSPKHGGYRFGANVSMPVERRELTNGHTVSRDDKGLAAVKSSHDGATAVPKLTLRNCLTHTEIVAPRATPEGRTLHPPLLAATRPREETGAVVRQQMVLRRLQLTNAHQAIAHQAGRPSAVI